LELLTLAYPGARNTVAYGIANDGTVVGDATVDSSSVTYTWTPSQGFTPFSPGSEAYGINVSGQIVGILPDGTTFVRDASGTYTQITIGTRLTIAIGINDAGQIVGEAEDITLQRPYAFIRETTGAYSTFQVPGSSQTTAFGINNLGQVVGQAGGGFLRDASGNFTTIAVPGAMDTAAAYGINDAGEIVGGYDTGNHNLAFYRSAAGQYYSLTLPGDGYAFGINNADQVVGRYVGPLGGSGGLGEFGFVADLASLNPTLIPGPSGTAPEPSTLTLFGIGLAGLAAYGWSRRKLAIRPSSTAKRLSSHPKIRDGRNSQG
jgi:uncharacterized membrane protein